MKYVEEWYEELELKEGRKVDKRRVFVASDDPKVGEMICLCHLLLLLH